MSVMLTPLVRRAGFTARSNANTFIACFASSSRSSAAAPTAQPSGSSKPAKAPKAKQPLSSVPAGTVFKGLSILKDKPDPVAKADEEYPAWLWSILDNGSSAKGEALSKDEEHVLGKNTKEDAEYFAREKKRLRAVNRANIKASNFLKTT